MQNTRPAVHGRDRVNASASAKVDASVEENTKAGPAQANQYFILEIFFYFAVYIVYISYGLWMIIKARDRILNRAKMEFATGWFFVGRPRDDSNDELENFNQYIRTTSLWYLLHVMTSTVVRIWLPHRHCLSQAVISALVLVLLLHPLPLCMLMALLMTYYAISYSNSKRAMWLLTGSWLIIVNLIVKSNYLHASLGYAEYYTFIIMLYWTLLRCCSFVLNRINAGSDLNSRIFSLDCFLGYTLYFPTLVYGPFIGFRRYVILLQAKQQTKEEWLVRFVTLAWELLRVGFWWFVMELALHFIYVHYMSHDIAAVQLVDAGFGKHAVGYFMGQFFFLHYVVVYGLGICIARFDGLNPPNGPRCIGRIHYYSDMWKYFDQGLYEFLFEHIYAELRAKCSKLLATAATFAFVFVWHGCYTYVLLWSALNFLCLVVEKVFKAVISWPKYSNWIRRWLGESGVQRLHALLATQIFIPAAFSNIYFFGGLEVGNLLMRGAYLSGAWNYIGLTLCSYCFFQCSEIISNLRNKVYS